MINLGPIAEAIIAKAVGMIDGDKGKQIMEKELRKAAKEASDERN